MPRVFISYRRTDSVTITGRIYDHLVRAFGDDNVFKDVDDIPLGADFRHRLHEEVSGCDVLLAIVGQTWVSTLDPAGERRLENPDDFVRIEIAAGLSRDRVLVVPVLVNGAPMPGSIDLPPDLQELAYRNAAIIRDDPDFRRDMDRLIAKITEFAAQAAPSEQAATQAEPQTPLVETPPVEATPPPSPAIPREQTSYQTRRLGPAPEEPPTPAAPRGFLPGPRLTILAGLVVVAIIVAVALILATQGGGAGGDGGARLLSGSDPATARLTCGGVYTGTIGEDDPSQTWQMPAEGQGEWVLLTMNGDPESELDPFLILRDPSGATIREDDDTGLGRNARLDEQLWTPGTWTVEATRYEQSGTGTYHLKVQCDFQPIDCNTEEYGTLSADNPGDWWLIYGEHGTRITVSMYHTGTNQDGTYLNPAVVVYDSADEPLVANDDLIEGDITAQTTFDVDDAALYLIEATRSESASSTGWGEYVLAVTCGSPDDPSQQPQSQQPVPQSQQ